jgi:hypothetical protein
MPSVSPPDQVDTEGHTHTKISLSISVCGLAQDSNYYLLKNSKDLKKMNKKLSDGRLKENSPELIIIFILMPLSIISSQ